MLKGMTYASALAASAVTAAPAFAATPIAITLEDDAAGFSKIVKNGFSYDYTFSLPFAGFLSASLNSSATTNPIVFSTVSLNGTALSKDKLSNSYYLPAAIASVAGPQVFHVEGVASGKSTAFSGTVQFITAVPEPAAWVLMVIGFGTLGASMRRRPRAGVMVYA